jgi:hypothetical protein
VSAVDFQPDPCEWHPGEARPARADDAPHADATVSLGDNGEWHLCETCAALPGFAACRVRKPLRRPGGTV